MSFFTIFKTGKSLIRFAKKVNQTGKKSAPLPAPDKQLLQEKEIPPHERILNEFEDQAMTIAERGIDHAIRQTPPQAIKDQIEQQAKEAKAELENLLHETRRLTEDRITDTKQALQKRKTVEAYKKELEAEKRQKLETARSEITLATADKRLQQLLTETGTVKGVEIALEEEIRQDREHYDQVSTLYNDLLINQYNNKIPVRKWIDHKKVFLTLIVGLALLEVLANFFSFQVGNLGDNNFIALVFAFFFAACQAYTAKLCGAGFYELQLLSKSSEATEIAKQKKWVIATFVFTLVLCFIVGAFRLGMDDPWLIKLVYVFINLIIASVTAYLAYSHTRNETFFTLQQQRSILARDIQHKGYQWEQIQEDAKDRQENIHLDMQRKAEQLAKDEKKRWKQQLTTLKQELVSLDSQMKKWLQQLENRKQNALRRYRYLCQNTQTGLGTLPFESSPNRRNGRVPNTGKILPIIALMTLLATGCTPKPATTIEVLFDRTDEQTTTPEIEPMMDFILTSAGVDLDKGGWGAVRINLSQIGETSSQTIATVHLPPSESFMLRNETEHKKIPDRFREELTRALQTVTQPGGGMDYSYIHRNYFYRLQDLSKRTGNRMVISFSDLIANDPKINLYQYRDNPREILQQRDTLIARMTEDYPLANLQGVKLINVYQPTRDNDELHESCKAYFRYYWQDMLGIEVAFKTNIPSQSLTLNSIK